MRVFIYEHFTALGVGREPGSPDHGIYREGRAMRDAVAADFARIPGVEVVAFPTPVRPQQGDWHLVVAPEFDGILSGLVGERERAGGRFLGSSVEATSLATDKLALAEHWRLHCVPTPATTDREPTACEAFPVVWKPRDGAGSTATFLLRSALDVAWAKAQRNAEPHAGPMILQEFVPGRAGSVAFLCGPTEQVALLPVFQHLSDDGRFRYLGGELPIPAELAERAVRLGLRAVGCVPGLLGYVGVDLVLGDAVDGSRDFAVEINPRLTTSYVGLRELADFNIASALWRVFRGVKVGNLRWRPGRVRFAPDGTATRF